MNINEFNNCIKELKGSSMFYMSLGSKELFHSNFLEFLWIINKTMFIELINKLVPNSLDKSIHYELSREKENFDLCLYHKQGRINLYDLVIENKVKSIPRKDQLDDYENKVKGRGEPCLILLSLVEEFPCKEGIPNWNIVNYEKLSYAIKEVYYDLEQNLQRYIDDYTEFVKTLHSMQKIIIDDFDNQIYFDKDVLNTLKNIRIHDLYIKLRGSMFISAVSERINNAKVHIMPFSIQDSVNSNKQRSFKYSDIRLYEINSDNINVFLECTIQQGVGMVAAYIYKKREIDYIYEIAIQGDQYRHGINSKELHENNPNDETMQNIWEKVYEYDHSFFDQINKINDTLPLGGFNKYKPEYVYKYVKLENQKVSELINIMAEDINIIVDKMKNNKC